jgi:hypothetical protein
MISRFIDNAFPGISKCFFLVIRILFTYFQYYVILRRLTSIHRLAIMSALYATFMLALLIKFWINGQDLFVELLQGYIEGLIVCIGGCALAEWMLRGQVVPANAFVNRGWHGRVAFY